MDKLGYGGWSTVWLAHDFQKKQYVALKVGIADSLPHEVTVLHALGKQTTVPGSAAIPRVLDEFRIEGPNGSHPCYTTAPALCNLRESSFSRLFRLDVARALAYELTLAVAYVHSRGYVHGDTHLRNVLVSAQKDFNQLSVAQFREKYGEPDSYPKKKPLNSPQDAHILLSDFGESFAPAEEPRLGKDCHAPVDFRPPEARFEPNTPLSFSADIWSLATAIWDILGMQALFSSAFYSDAKVMCQIVDTLGPLPSDWFEKWEDQEDFFDAKGKPKPGRHVWPKIQGAFEETVQQYRRDDNMGEFCEEETAAILDMMVQMLRYRPEERPTVQQVLQSDWMVKWARADYSGVIGPSIAF
ncbi:protein kinase domain-containing protein, partial [Metarhizium majus ARSEF 297]